MKNEGLEIAGLEYDGLIKMQRLVKVGQDLIQLQSTIDCFFSCSVGPKRRLHPTTVKLSTCHYFYAVMTRRCCGKLVMHR